jgi:predicted DNA-binding transcriptional regulator AlpA
MNPPTPRYIKAPEVMRMFRIGRRRLNSAIKAGTLPAPVELGPRCRVWDLEELKVHLAKRNSRRA